MTFNKCIAGLFIKNSPTEQSVPLKSIDVKTIINNICVDVVCSFKYKNETKDLIEADFIFPLDSNSAVYAFEALIGNKHFIAKCRERIEAETTYKEAVEKGHTAFMMQEDERMGDTFKMTIGNIPPDESVTIKLKYIDQLQLRKVDVENPRYRLVKSQFVSLFVLPTVLNLRYQPSTTAIEQQFDNLTSSSKRDQKNYCFTFSAEISGNSPLLDASSENTKYHIEYTSEDKKKAMIRLDGEHDLSKDLELELAYADTDALLVAYEEGSGEEKDKDGFLGMDCLVANFLPSLDKKIDERCEIIFLIDRSGSMAGSQIENARQSLLLFLKSLPEQCRFQIVGFGSTHASLFDQPQDYTEESLNRALEYQKTMQADMGGTEVLSALRSVYDVPLTGAGWDRRVIFLTDGDVCNQDEVIGLVKSNQNSSRMFAIGLGDGVSTSLLWGISRAGRGKAVFVRSSNDLRAATIEILQHALQPCVRDVKLTWDVSDVDGKHVSVCTIPSQLPPLFSDTYMTAVGLVVNPKRLKLQGKATLTFTVDGAEQKTLVAPIPDSSSAQTLLHRQAAKLQILELVDQHSAMSTAAPDSQKEQLAKLRQQIVSLSVSANVISPFTAFIGVDPDALDEALTHAAVFQIPTFHPGSRGRTRLKKGGFPVMSCMALPLIGSSVAGNLTKMHMSSQGIVCGGPKRHKAICRGGYLPDSNKVSQLGMEKAETQLVSDAILNLAELQSFTGSWNSLESLAAIFKVSAEKLKPPKEITEAVWATAIVLAYLELKEIDRKAEWDMMANKALGWLAKQVARKTVDEVNLAAKSTLSALLNVSK